MKTLSNSSIYTDVWKIVTSSDYLLYLFIGGRGIGKTYSCLKGVIESQKHFIYLRRTDAEIQECCTESENPFKTLNHDMAWNIQMFQNKKRSLIYDMPIDDSDEQGELIGYARSLSTSGRVRGSDYSDVDYIIFDEWICTSMINTLKNEATYLFNLIETVNRNRELQGKDSVKVILLSNANTINDDIIRVLKLGDIIRNMKISNVNVYTDVDRGIYLSLLDNKKVRDMKEKTRLYRLTKGTTFYDMSLENDFTTDYFGDIKRLQFNELTPVACYEKIYFYKHKVKNILYASYRKAQCSSYDQLTLKAFKRDYGFMIGNYIERGLIFYQNYDIKLNVQNIFK